MTEFCTVKVNKIYKFQPGMIPKTILSEKGKQENITYYTIYVNIIYLNFILFL